MLNPEIKIFLYVIVNFVVGYFAATGRINASSKDILINQTTDIIGQIILLTTSCVTLYKVLVHPHTTSSQVTVTQKAVADPLGGQKTDGVSQQINEEIGKMLSQPVSQPETPVVLQQTGLPIGSHN